MTSSGRKHWLYGIFPLSHLGCGQSRMSQNSRIRGKTTKGRASEGAVAKRRAARQLNRVLTDAQDAARLDGRTEKKRRRLVAELVEGRRGEPLKPIDAVCHVHELLELGETMASIKRQGVKMRRTPLTAEVRAAVTEAQGAYEFRREAWLILGIRLDRL